jgi:cytochrome c oxidase cbb3-type subunit 3
MQNKSAFVLFLAAFFLATISVQAQAKETAPDNYKAYCVQCHGMEGNGKGLNIRDMSVQPRDHTEAKSMSGRSDEALFKVIKEGGSSISKSVLMPPWAGALTDEEIKDLVQHLRTLCKCQFGT